MTRPRSKVRRALFLVVFASAFPVVVMGTGCKKPPPPQEDASPPPPPSDTGPVAVAPLEDDAGDAGDAGQDAAKHWTGPGMSPNEAKVRACCAKLNMLPNATSPEVQALKAQCNQIAAAVHANPNAPELNMLKSIPGC